MVAQGSDPGASKPITWKLANALYPDAEPVASLSGTPAVSGLGWVRRKYGGLWVGGTASLYPDWFVFEPNATNRAVHEAIGPVAISLSQVTSVSVRFGFLTNIIDIHGRHGTLSLRCFGARKFAQRINDAAKIAGAAP